MSPFFCAAHGAEYRSPGRNSAPEASAPETALSIPPHAHCPFCGSTLSQFRPHLIQPSPSWRTRSALKPGLLTPLKFRSSTSADPTGGRGGAAQLPRRISPKTRITAINAIPTKNGQKGRRELEIIDHLEESGSALPPPQTQLRV